MGCGKSRAVAREENQMQVFLPSHRPWKSRKTRGIPTFPTAPTTAGICQTKSGNLVVVDRKEYLTPDIADIRLRAGLVSFAIIFSFDSTLRADSTGRFTAFDYSGIFHWLVRCLLGLLFSGRFRPCVRASVFYLTRTTTGRLDPCGSLLCISARCHASKVMPANLEQGLQI